MFQVYILKSIKKNQYYIGHTKDLNTRFKRHNQGLVRSTKGHRPWIIIYTENKKTRGEAYKRELQIKSYKKGEAFKKLIAYFWVDGRAVKCT